MPKKLDIAGIVDGVTIDHYHTLDLTLEPDPVTGFGPFLGDLVATGTTTASVTGGGILMQLAETDNVLTTVTIIEGGSFGFPGSPSTGNYGDFVVTDIAATATSPTTIHSSLKLIDASATTSVMQLYAGATNTSSEGEFHKGSTLNSNITITYDGLTIEGGSGQNIIENDATNGIVTEGNHDNDDVILAGTGASAILGTGANDQVSVGASDLGTNEAPGQALGETVTFGTGAKATLLVGAGDLFPTSGQGAEAGPTAGTQNIGQTNVNGAAAGMTIDFHIVTTSSTISDETNAATVAAATTLTAKENAAVVALGGPGVAYFTYQGDEYFIATNTTETLGVGFNDAVVHLVGVQFSHPANSGGIVTLG